MPELPEVEVIREGLSPLLLGRTITKITFSNKRLRLPVPTDEIIRLIKGQKISEVRRRAKYLVIVMRNGSKLIIHLGMTGKLRILPVRNSLARHDHLRFQLDNNMDLRFNDTRRFGSIQILNPDADEQAFFGALGPEPLGKKLTAKYLQDKAGNRSQPVKNFLMDSHVVVGIGNIYANEIPFAAGIPPQRQIGKISLHEWQKIIRQTRRILNNAIAAGGSTIADFIGANGKPGYFQLQLKVYGRAKQPCPVCGQEIQKTVMAGRATFWCPKCQK